MGLLKMTPRNRLATLLVNLGALTAILFWGLSFVSTKVIMSPQPGYPGLSPTEAYVYRFTIAYLIILAISHKQIMCHNFKDELLMLLCGLSSGSIYFIAENTALQLTLTSNVSLLSATSPLITVMLVGIIYKSERPGLGLIIGSLIAFVGVVCVVLNSFSSAESLAINPLGDLIALSSAFCWAFYSLVLKRVNAQYDAMFITRKTFFYGLVTALPFLAFEPKLVSPVVMFENIDVLFNIVFLALGASIAAFYLWAISIERLGAVKANNYLYFQPVVTLVASAIILGEKISILGYLGFALIMFGLFYGDYLQKRLQIKNSVEKRQTAPDAPQTPS